MTTLEIPWSASTPRISRWVWIWLLALSFAFLLWIFAENLPWLVAYPKSWIVPLAKYTTVVMTWIKNNLSWLTRAVSDVLQVQLRFIID